MARLAASGSLVPVLPHFLQRGLTMWGFSIGQALGLIARTLPFVLFRVIVCFGVTVAIILATGTGAGLGWGVGAFGDDGFRANATFYGDALGFVLTVGVIYFLRVCLLYAAKAIH